MNVHLINPSSVSFGTAVITPRWQYVLAAATPKSFGDPILVDETLAQVRPDSIEAGDVVGIGIHTANALRGYEIGKAARSRGASTTSSFVSRPSVPPAPNVPSEADSVCQPSSANNPMAGCSTSWSSV